MELSKGTKLILRDNIWVVSFIRTNNSIPMSKFDTEPTPVYGIQPEFCEGDPEWDKAVIWYTFKEMSAIGFRPATRAEVILYGER